MSRANFHLSIFTSPFPLHRRGRGNDILRVNGVVVYELRSATRNAQNSVQFFFSLTNIFCYIYNINMIYEWDNEKNEINKKKHDGIGFELAVRVFLDSKRIEKYDSAHSTSDEDRWNVIGMVENVLFVVYTERGDRTRIISARKATQEEINEYNDNYDLR